MGGTNKYSDNQRGFTLVEIAVVLVIIGLLVGGVLKGQAMIQNAKVKKVVKMADEMRAAVMTFYDKYGMYPGDENQSTPPGDSFNGNGNGRIDIAERFEVFRDLSLAGLISGSYTGTETPRHPFGGVVDIVWVDPPGATTPAAHYLRFFDLPAEVCQEIDTKYDDGNYQTGSIVGSAAYNPGATIGTLYIMF